MTRVQQLDITALTEAERLEPCRHCGHTETKTLSDGCASYHVMCLRCMAFGPLAPFEAAAEEAWNQRVERTCKFVPCEKKNAIPGFSICCDQCGREIFKGNLPYMNFCPSCGARIVREETQNG